MGIDFLILQIESLKMKRSPFGDNKSILDIGEKLLIKGKQGSYS